MGASFGQKQSPYRRKVEQKEKYQWPVLFWLILNMLGLFHHESIVGRRKCYSCHVKKLMDRRRETKMAAIDIEIDPLVLTYEWDERKTEVDERTWLLSPRKDLQETAQEHCDICESLWWNCDRESKSYNENDIGYARWSHKRQNVLSTIWLLVGLSLFVYDFLLFFPWLFGKPDQMLHLILRLTLYCALVIPIVFILCSKIRSHWKSSASRMRWATTMNMRYIVKRAQILDLSRRGLPGRSFLICCVCFPAVTSLYRSAIFLFVGDCGITVTKVFESLFGIIFTIQMGLLFYILYLIRISFQHQFNVLLGYMSDYVDDQERCKGILLEVVADFNCYKQFCGLYTVVLFPVAVLAVVANLTWNYLSKQTCLWYNEDTITIQTTLMILSWLEIVTLFGLYTVALGGLDVRYIWENFISDLLLMKSKKYTKFWEDVVIDAEYLLNGSFLLIITIIGTVTSIYLSFQFDDQNVAFLTQFCNGSFADFHCRS